MKRKNFIYLLHSIVIIRVRSLRFLFQIESSTFFDHITYNIYDIYDVNIHLQDRFIVKGSTKDADTLLKRSLFWNFVKSKCYLKEAFVLT